jgi:hypothetical protein
VGRTHPGVAHSASAEAALPRNLGEEMLMGDEECMLGRY